MQFFKVLLAIAPLASAQLFDLPTIPWGGPVGVVPRLECACECADAASSEAITRELCQMAIDAGRKKEIRIMEDGSCAFWGLDITLMYKDLAKEWGKDVCTEKGCNASSSCNYIGCTGISKEKVDISSEILPKF